MLAEEFFSTVSGPPLASNTSIPKDVGVYVHTLSPSYSVTATFKKSNAPPHCLAVSDSHVFTAQQDKASYVHVYSRLRGNQEAFVPLPEAIRCLTIVGDVLIAGTAGGRVVLWETCTGRLISTPPSHVQGVSCLAATPNHVLSGSDDSNILVWSLPRLLAYGTTVEPEAERTLANHRGAITALVASPSTNVHTSLCVSASKDKSCVLWNYQSGVTLRTILLPTSPLCLTLDPGTRALTISAEDGSLFLVELFGNKPLLGPNSEDMSSVVEVGPPLGVAPADAGPATCAALSHDGTVLLTGHPKGKLLQWSLSDNSLPVELANLNVAVTNVVVVPPLSSSRRTTQTHTVVRPAQADKSYTLTTQFVHDIAPEVEFATAMNEPGFSTETLEEAIAAFEQPVANTAGDQELRQQNAELQELLGEQRKLYQEMLGEYTKLKAAKA